MLSLNKVTRISITPLEFLWKMMLTFFCIMPLSIVGGAYGMYNIALIFDNTSPLFIILGASVGTIVGFILTLLLLKYGHKEDS